MNDEGKTWGTEVIDEDYLNTFREFLETKTLPELDGIRMGTLRSLEIIDEIYQAKTNALE